MVQPSEDEHEYRWNVASDVPLVRAGRLGSVHQRVCKAACDVWGVPVVSAQSGRCEYASVCSFCSPYGCPACTRTCCWQCMADGRMCAFDSLPHSLVWLISVYDGCRSVE